MAQLEDGERPKISAAPKRRIYTREELQQTLAATAEPWHTLFAFAAITGARLSECLGLIWADLELDDVATAAVSFEFQVDREGRRQPLKTDESRRTVELPRQLAAMLVQHKLASLRSTPGDFVFASRSGPLGQRNVLRALRRAQERAVDGRGRPTFPALHQRDERGRSLPVAPGVLPTFHSFRHRGQPRDRGRRVRRGGLVAARTPQQRRYAGGLRPRTQDSRANRATTPAHGRSIRPVPVLDRHSMSRATATPDAPPALVAATHAVRRLIVAVDLNGSVHGWCVEASLILGWMLRQQGLPAEMRSCSAEGDPHWCITSGNGILDPTSGQWGEEPLLVFREGSSDDWYGPGREGPADISEDAIVHRSPAGFLTRKQPRFSR